MRPPWLQVDTDFLEAKAGDLGAMLGVSRREAVGICLDLWLWVLKRGPDSSPPDGIVRGTRVGTAAEPLLERAASWSGPEGQLVAALEEIGLLERIPDGLRFRGIGRYQSVWKRNRSGNRTAAEPQRNRSGVESEPPTKNQIKNQKKEDPALEGQQASIPGLAPAERPRRKLAKKPPDPRHTPLVVALVAAAPGYSFAGGADGVAVTRLLELADSRPHTAGDKAIQEILRRWKIARAHVGYPGCKSLTELATDRCWNHFAREQPPQRGPAPPSDFSQPPAEPMRRSEFAPEGTGDESF